MRTCLSEYPKLAAAWTLSVLEIDDHPEWLERYDELVPVLLVPDEEQQWCELFHYHFDPVIWNAWVNHLNLSTK